ncbi:MAG: hypothetical protein K6F55_07600 [Eubacterium sp.]|nr:hypothetical protein [Eubacterium sp.]
MDDNDCLLGGYFDEFGHWVDDPDFKGYDIFPRTKGGVNDVITINWTDSTSSTGNMFDLMDEVRERLVEAGQLPEDANIRMDWRVWHDQTPENTWEPGYHQVMLRYCGVDSYYDVLVFGERGSYYGLATEGDDWVYCEDGFVSTTTTGFEKGPVADTFTKTEEGRIPTHYVEDTDDQYYYVIDGVVATGFNGLAAGTIDGKDGLYMVADGRFDYLYEGFGYYNGDFWYVHDGAVDTSVSGIVTVKDETGDDVTAYLDGGRIDYEFTGFVGTWQDDTIYYVYEGLVPYDFSGPVDGIIDGDEGCYYVTNGLFDSTFCDFAQLEGDEENYWYFCSGQLNPGFTDLVMGTIDETVGLYMVTDGKFDPSYNGFRIYEDDTETYYYVKDGVVDTTFTGPVTGTIDGLKAWYYVTEGKLDREFKGFALVGSSWMYFTNGFVDKTLHEDHYGTFWGTVNGVSGWYVVKKGKAYPEFKGFALVGESWYYFTDGQIDKTLNEDFYGTVYGTVGEEKGYFVVKKGKVYPEYTGFALVGSSWMYYKDGKMDKSVTGAMIINIKGDKRWYYVKSGKVIMDYTGFAEVSSSTMYFKNGKIDKTVTGIFTGTIKGVKAQYYVKKGVFQKTYTGTLKQDGYKYTIKNGKVTKKEKI